MMDCVAHPLTNSQITAWLRGLLTIAWADGEYEPEEQELIAQLTQELAVSDVPFSSITPEELADELKEQDAAEDFLRTAVMVAVADGVYSSAEAELLKQFNDALGLKVEALKSLEHTLYNPEQDQADQLASSGSTHYPHSDILQPVKEWLDGLDVKDQRIAKFVCKMVPPQCPFERDVKLFGRKIVHIPPLCKLNPLYEQLVGLRFRSLSYLADECEEDVSQYI
ncbi:MAG: Mo-dependent nitrogenase C-terminal domain-containing protein [Cyanophyceae cyanobacterium]